MDQKNYANALENYPKITIFSDEDFFVPIFIVHVGLILFSLFMYRENFEYAVGVGMLTPVFIIVYIFGAKRVTKYNENLSKRIVVKGIIDDIVIYPMALFMPAKIEVSYKYIDPFGIEHNSFQTVNQLLSPKVKWKNLYKINSETMILLNSNNYRDSYLPMSEDYSRKYYNIYMVQLGNRLL